MLIAILAWDGDRVVVEPEATLAPEDRAALTRWGRRVGALVEVCS